MNSHPDLSRQLFTLVCDDSQQVTQHEVASFTGMDRMHISQIVARLEKEGLLEIRLAGEHFS